ncbi:MAG: DUF2270 domain-containing protein [Planctomycetes bacterium]|nr:DUF2270 domain-containing protein [Planctomycetota bacterium]
MTQEAREARETPPERRAVDYESTPLTRQEYISAIVHLYRGELDRATTWRLRLDATTNWAIITTAGILSYSFGNETHTHLGLLVGFPLVSVFWMIEARRYRYADIWFARVRKIEENFYGPILRRDPVSPKREWGQLVAEDLFRPRFKVSVAYALRKRLIRNYWAIFGVLLGAWAVKLIAHPTPARGWAEVRERLSVGLLPWWLPCAFLLGFLGFLGWLAAAAHGGAEERAS